MGTTFGRIRKRSIYRCLCQRGKISGEHGIGTVRKAFMVTYTDPVELELMKALKKAWDPDLILNPGKIFDIDG